MLNRTVFVQQHKSQCRRRSKISKQVSPEICIFDTNTNKECLKNDIVPFIITDDLKMFYYRGIREWKTEPGYLTDTCLTAQDHFKALMDYFRIPYAPNA